MTEGSAFDSAAFLAQAMAEGEMDTKYPTVPEGDYIAVIGDGEKDIQAVQREGKDGEPFTVLEIQCNLIEEHKRPPDWPESLPFRARGGVFLEIEPDGKTISVAPGKNVQLGSVREAVNQNTGGAWSPLMLRGAGPLLVHVKHSPNEKDSTSPFVNIDRWAKYDPSAIAAAS